MGDKTGIQWTDATWNPVTGCTKVSPGCKNCYAKHQAWPRLAAMKTGVYSGRKFEDVQCHPERLDQPLRWKKPRMVFVNSMSDLFHDAVPFTFVAEVFGVMAACPQHRFQVLTKRPEQMREFVAWLSGGICADAREIIWEHAQGGLVRAGHGLYSAMQGRLDNGVEQNPGWPLPNVWLGVSVENQETADERIPLLLDTPAAVRWISAEPLLAPLYLDDQLEGWQYHAPLDDLDWVVVGGESGPNARDMDPDWARSLRDQCATAGVPFFMKQMARKAPIPDDLMIREYPQRG